MKPKRFYILIISLLCTHLAFAQSVEEVVRFANNQFQEGNYTIASKEYNRALFFGYEPKDELCLKIAQCYQHEEQYGLASGFYDRAFSAAITDSLRCEAILGKAYCLLLSEEYQLSVSELLNMPEESNHDQKIAYHFLKAIAHYGAKADSASHNEFVNLGILSGFSSTKMDSLRLEFERVFSYNKKYNPNRSYILSGFVPGLGQLSTGAIKDGINSMLLVGGLYVLSVYLITNYSFWDAFISIFPWVQRYHLGGMDKAKGLALSKIDEKRYLSYLNLLELATPNSFQ